MKIVLRVLGGLVAVALSVLLVIFVYGRFSDGPIGFFSGGPLEQGEMVSVTATGWGFATEVPTIEFQLAEPPRSRTVWLLVEDGRAYIPCGAPNFKLLKKWPHEALKDGRALVRIEGKRYAVQLVKIDEAALRAALLEKIGAKYGLPPGGDDADDPDEVWFFRLDPRSA